MYKRQDLFSPLRYWWDDCECKVEYPQVDLEDWWDSAQDKITNKSYVVTKKYTRQQVIGKGLGSGLKKPKVSRTTHNLYNQYNHDWWSGEDYYRHDWRTEAADEDHDVVESVSPHT